MATLSSLINYSIQGVQGATGSPWGGGTFTGDTTYNGNAIISPKLQAAREAVTALGSLSGTLSIDCSLSNIFSATLTGAITTFTVSNVPASGAYSFTLVLTQGGAGGYPYSMVYPSGTKWTDSVVAVLGNAVNKIDVLTFFTIDGGTTWLAGHSLANL